MKDRDLCHKAVPHEPKKVPISTLTYRRGNVFWFRRRIPQDLVDARAYGSAQEVRESLRTSDPRKAEELAHHRALELLDEWDTKRRELNLGFERRANSGDRLRSLSSVSDLEKRAFIHRLFLGLERKALRDGVRDPDALDDDEKEQVVLTLKEHLAGMTGSPEYAPFDWSEELQSALREEGIGIDSPSEPSFVELKQLYRDAYIESASNSLNTLLGRSTKTKAPFSGMGLGTEPPRQEQVDAERCRTLSLRNLGAAYLEELNARRSRPKTLRKAEENVELMLEVWGPTTPVDSIGKTHGGNLIESLARMPLRWKQRYPGLTLAKAAKLEAKNENPELLAEKSQIDRLNGISAILGFAADEGWIDRNPLSNRTLRKRLPKVRKTVKPMMTPDDIQKVFCSEEFLSERHHEGRGEARFWVSLLCLFHGVRSNEACQLLVTDVRENDGVAYFDLKIEDEEGNDMKDFKTEPSTRRLPLHDEIVRIGFLEFVEKQRRNGEVWLFPALSPNKMGTRADPIGKWFGRLRKKLLVNLPKVKGAKGLHSFRHLFQRKMREAEVPLDIQFFLGGWSDLKPRNSSIDYGGIGIDALKKAIDRVGFPGVDFSPLYVDPGAQ